MMLYRHSNILFKRKESLRKREALFVIGTKNQLIMQPVRATITVGENFVDGE